MPYQPSGTQRTAPTPSAKHLTFMLGIPSFQYAGQVAELLNPAYPPLAPQLPPVAGPSSAGAAEEAKEQLQNDLRALAQWPPLHDPTLPPPLVGETESDPSGVADRYGVKGQPVLTAFVNQDDFSCKVCSFKADTLQLALLHQGQVRHFRS
jgi:hypothetical protein